MTDDFNITIPKTLRDLNVAQVLTNKNKYYD